MQSARADTDQAESIASRRDSLPRELTPSLGVPGPVWADLETHTRSYSTAAAPTGKECCRTMPGHVPCSHSFLGIGPFDQPSILEFLRILFG